MGFNDTFNAYAYAILLSASLLLMMEAIMLTVGFCGKITPEQAQSGCECFSVAY